MAMMRKRKTGPVLLMPKTRNKHLYAERLSKLLEVLHISMGSLVHQELNPHSSLYKQMANVERSWMAEENRHGDLLHTYLYLPGWVDILKTGRTVQRLIGAGMVIPITYMILLYKWETKAKAKRKRR
ncbi:hypothetical protein C1H46_036313 [Malus baccata]|uniref:Stearoyl-[acyl-carrier-protein] 9-desaturase n=1 Tax=Malus baccata TaxID=106549 RepID=A0A540KV99_MALBA|nr:hypothetical protein C1H46_036313 [Malus baccata]